MDSVVDHTVLEPYVLFFEDVTDQPVGGKAAGLAELVRLGFDVPPGFVIVNARKGIYPEALSSAYQKIGSGKVAVRSSALGEDAADNSFAGQFETILNVDGMEALEKAIDDCVESLCSERAKAYQEDQSATPGNYEQTMCIVVQTMVPAHCAGVLFTADPVSGRYDRMIIDAVSGLGETLVDGSETPDHYVLDRNNHVVHKDIVNKLAILSNEKLQEMAVQARNGAKLMGKPLDMEWACDDQGHIFWLQARPITTIGSDLNELDDEINEEHILTRCNIGEVIPGAACPLTLSLQKPAFSDMLKYIQHGFTGRKPDEDPDMKYMVAAYGFIFFDMTVQLEACKYSALATAEYTAQSICGRRIPELQEPLDKKNIIRRLWSITYFFRFLSGTQKIIADFAQRMQSFYIQYHDKSLLMIDEINNKIPSLYEANRVHAHSSFRSGTYESLLTAIVAKDRKAPDADDMALAAKIMGGASHVESAVLVEQLDELVKLVAAHPDGKSCFADVETPEALAWLQGNQGNIRKAFEAFMYNHGHRGFRELELMSPAWVDEPSPLIESMQASVLARLSGMQSSKHESDFDIANQPWIIRYLSPRIHDAIRGREQTKSLLVRMTHHMKQAYSHLGELMLAEGLLTEADQVFFFTHDEIKPYILNPGQATLDRIKQRKIAYSFQEKLAFDDIFVGYPEPVEFRHIELEDGQMLGRPVSKGIVEGKARVAMNVREASALKAGEILIAPYTDVAWTPYFSMIAGLATDIGSAVSHGAVIAREYGLPCIVNLQGATSVFKTGDTVRLDAETGILSKIS